MKSQTLKRDAFSIKTPDGKTIPLATQKEYAERPGPHRAEHAREGAAGFAQLLSAGRDTLEGASSSLPTLARGTRSPSTRSTWPATGPAFGRLFFKVPGGIQPGQHWLVVKFATSEVQVPFRILTKEEEKEFRKKWEDIKKAFDAELTK